MTENITSAVNAGNEDKKSVHALERFMEQIPVLPEAVYSAQKLLNQDELDIDNLVEVLESDPGLVVKILRIANSSFYGLSREIKSVRDACIVLGQHTLRNIIMTTVVVNTVQGQCVEKTERYQLLGHCISTAIIARILAEMTGLNRDVAYIVGLLHDIGSLFIEVISPDDAMSIREEMLQTKWKQDQAEQQFLGFDHAELSGEVARYWRLPEEIAVSLQFHHKIQLSTSRLNDLIYVADCISTNFDEHENDSDFSDVIPVGVMERLGLDETLISECIEIVKASNDIDLYVIVGQE